MKTAVVNLKDIINSGMILSAEFHINRVHNKQPYRLKNNKYEPVSVKNLKGNETYLSLKQVSEINNVLIAIAEIKKEIKNIKNDTNKIPSKRK